MLKKLASLSVIVALVCTLGGVPAFAQSPSAPGVKSDRVSVVPDADSALKTEAQPRESLKAEIAKAVRDAKAGKGLKVSDPQNQPAQSNSLSKTTKIAIAVGAGVAILLIILFIHARDNFFD